MTITSPKRPIHLKIASRRCRKPAVGGGALQRRRRGRTAWFPTHELHMRHGLHAGRSETRKGESGERRAKCAEGWRSALMPIMRYNEADTKAAGHLPAVNPDTRDATKPAPRMRRPSCAVPHATAQPPIVPRSILRDRMIDVVVRSTPSSVPIWSSRSLSRSGESARSHAT